MKASLVAGAVVAVLLPLSAACSSSKDIASTDQTTTTPTTPSQSTTTPPPTTAPPSTPPPTPPPTTSTPSADGNRLPGTGFSIEIPADWEDITASLKAKNPQLDIAINENNENNPTTFRTNFNVVLGGATTESIERNGDAIRKEAATELQTVTHAAVTSLPDSTIDGEAAIGQTSTLSSPSTPITFVLYIAIHNGTTYPVTMTYATSNAAKAKPVLTTILTSWQWDS